MPCFSFHFVKKSFLLASGETHQNAVYPIKTCTFTILHFHLRRLLVASLDLSASCPYNSSHFLHAWLLCYIFHSPRYITFSRIRKVFYLSGSVFNQGDNIGQNLL